MRWLLLFIVLNLLLGPLVVRVPLVDWTLDPETGIATAGVCVWPLGIVLDSGAWGDQVREHEECHWRNHDTLFFTDRAAEAAERMCD